MIRRSVASVGLALLVILICAVSPVVAASKPNLVLITLDSARADRMGFLGANSALTPNLNHLAAESIVFDHAYAQAPGTVASHASILSGSYPQSTGLSEIGGILTPSLPFLPELLKAQGYHTAAFVGSIELDPWNGLAQGFDRGFQSYDAGFRPVSAGDSRPPVTERSGAEVVARAITWLSHNNPSQNNQGPFFLWVHLNDASAAHASYNAALTAADAAVGKLIGALKQQKLDGNTAVVVVADHGQSLGAHGEDAHGIFLYDEAIHVPLLIKLPEAQPSTKPVTAKVRLVDVAPTLLEIAVIPVPSQMQGQSLLRIAKSGGGGDQPVYSRGDLSQRGFGWSPLESWRASKYLYIRAPKPELYDMTADPGATHNLAASSKATLDTLAGQLDSFDRKFSGDTGKSACGLSSAEMQKLRSLGYVSAPQCSGHAAAVAGTDPKDKIATANKVIEAAATAKPDRVVAALAPVSSADPNLYLAEYTLGVAQAQKGQFAEAAKHLHKAIELQADSGWANYEIGAVLLKTGDFKTAAVHLEIAAGRLPGFAAVHGALGQAYEHLGRSDDAKREQAKAEKK
jgi:choline-sulfatase